MIHDTEYQTEPEEEEPEEQYYQAPKDRTKVAQVTRVEPRTGAEPPRGDGRYSAREEAHYRGRGRNEEPYRPSKTTEKDRRPMEKEAPKFPSPNQYKGLRPAPITGRSWRVNGKKVPDDVPEKWRSYKPRKEVMNAFWYGKMDKEEAEKLTVKEDPKWCVLCNQAGHNVYGCPHTQHHVFKKGDFCFYPAAELNR